MRKGSEKEGVVWKAEASTDTPQGFQSLLWLRHPIQTVSWEGNLESMTIEQPQKYFYG